MYHSNGKGHSGVCELALAHHYHPNYIYPSYYGGNFWHFGFEINNKINKHLFILFIYFSKSIKKSTFNFQVLYSHVGYQINCRFKQILNLEMIV